MHAEAKILIDLRHNWDVAAFDFDIKGYWTFEDNSFDLTDLRLKEEATENKDGQIYLTVGEESIRISIVGDESYYEVTKLTDTELNVTCYWQSRSVDHGLMKLGTLTLRKK